MLPAEVIKFVLPLLTVCLQAVATPTVCSQIMYIAGSRDYAYVEGLYILQQDKVSSKPVYKHACHDNYVYFDDDSNAWWIGPILGSSSGFALTYSSGDSPNDVDAPWRYYSYSDKQWYYDIGAKVVCLDISCQKLVMSSPLELPYYATGDFHLTDIIHFDRPVYESAQTGLFLFHGRTSRLCAVWFVGPTIGDADKAFMYVHADTRDPLDVSTTWTMTKGEADTQQDNCSTNGTADIGLTCLEYYQYYSNSQQQSTTSPRTIAYSDNADTSTIKMSTSAANEEPSPSPNTNQQNNESAVTQSQSQTMSLTTQEPISVNGTEGHSVTTPNTRVSNETTEIQQGVCGRVLVQSRAVSFLISAQNSPFQGKWPWMVAILKPDNRTKCGATIVSERFLVTAAHCIDGGAAQLASFTLLAGANNRNMPEEGVQKNTIKRIILHENFTFIASPFRLSNDIGIIETTKPFTFSTYVQPICLPPGREYKLPFVGRDTNITSCYIIGFGYYKIAGFGRSPTSSGILQQQSVRLQTIQSCARSFRVHQGWLAESDNICVRPNSFAKLCQGDSGSPLMCLEGSQWTLAGVASWSVAACIGGNIPSIYVDTRLHADWIRQQIGNQMDGS